MPSMLCPGITRAAQRHSGEWLLYLELSDLEAQAEAMANFQESPGQRYLREQTERGVLRNAAAVGGLGGGNVLKALQANAAGLAAQDFQNQFNRLANVANRGASAAGRTADPYSSLGGRQAGFRNEMGSGLLMRKSAEVR